VETYYKRNRERLLAKSKENYFKNKERKIAYSLKYQKENKDKKRVWAKRYREANKHKRTQWLEANKDRVKAQLNTRDRVRRTEDINYKLSCNLRSRLYKATKGIAKGGSAVDDLGCSLMELRLHISSQFQEGMNWQNWGIYGWHIDHIQPLSSFNLSNKAQYKRAVHYSNLQPLWAKDNILKRNAVT